MPQTTGSAAGRMKTPARRGNGLHGSRFSASAVPWVCGPGIFYVEIAVPTEEKRTQVDSIRELLETCEAAVSADYTGLTAQSMTEFRQSLRERGVRFRVVKNTLTHLAADAAGKPGVKEIVEGPTGIAFGFDDPAAPARAIREFIRVSRSPMTIRGGLLGERVLTAEEVERLADLPSKDDLIARLMGQLQAPITGLAYVLNAPTASLARVLQRKIETESGEPADE